MNINIGRALLAATAAFALSGCATDNYGYGGGIGMGYGNSYYGGDPYWGWNDNFFYPGTGYYIYDRGGNRHRWSNNQRRYWEGRRGGRPGRENWQGYSPTNNMPWRAQRRGVVRPGVTAPNRDIRREAWRAQRQQQGATSQDRAARREAWRAQRQQQGVSREGRREGWGARRPQSGQESRGRGGWGGGREGRRGRD